MRSENRLIVMISVGSVLALILGDLIAVLVHRVHRRRRVAR
jgi:hypothetical protein